VRCPCARPRRTPASAPKRRSPRGPRRPRRDGQRAFGGSQALSRACVGGAQRERATEQVDRAAAGFADLTARERRLALFAQLLTVLDAIDLLQEALDIRPLQRDHAQHGRRVPHALERDGIRVDVGQRFARLQQ
jgi:hypothetical protein